MIAVEVAQQFFQEFPAYPEYENSEIEWIKLIPSHWQVCQLKRVAHIRYGLGQPPPELVDGVPLIRATNIKSGSILEEEMMYVDPSQVPDGKDAVLSLGEILVVRSGAYTGDSAIISGKYIGAIAGYDMVASIKKDFSNFFGWQILSNEVRDIQFGFHKLRAAQPHLNAEELGGTFITIPPLEEQKTIAHFLDRATAEIDRIIEQQQQLIALLEEEHTTVISHAVTKGIGRSVPMKDSGVEWLGEIPEHWKTIALKRTAKQGYKTFIDGDWIEAPYVTDEGIRLIQTGNIGIGEYIEKGFRYISEATFKNFVELEADFDSE